MRALPNKLEHDVLGEDPPASTPPRLNYLIDHGDRQHHHDHAPDQTGEQSMTQPEAAVEQKSDTTPAERTTRATTDITHGRHRSQSSEPRTSGSRCHVALLSGSGRGPAGHHQPAVGRGGGRVSLHSRMIWRWAMYQLWPTLVNESR